MKSIKVLIAIVIMLILVSGGLYYLFAPIVDTNIHSILNTDDKDWKIVAINDSISGESVDLTTEDEEKITQKLFEARLYKNRFSKPYFDMKDKIYHLVLNNKMESFFVTIDGKGNIAILFNSNNTLLKIDKKATDYIFNVISK